MRLSRFLAVVGVVAVGVCSRAADDKKASKNKAPAQRETIAKPMSDRQKRQAEERLRKELETPYKRWLNEEVTYIITDEERKTFSRFQTDEERQNFIESFWFRRDPTPDTEENEYREEHYRRIAYANDRFASGVPGWKTDRGRIYIAFGPPDEREEHPTGGNYARPIEEGGGNTTVFPFEKWRYRYIDGIGTDVIIEFVDPSMTNEYHMTMDPSEKDALARVPGAGLTLYEQLGLANKADRFSRTDGTLLGTGNMPLPARMNVFDRLQQYAMLQKPPSIKFKDLEAVVTSSIKYNLLPMRVRVDFVPVTPASVLAYFAVQFERKDLQFKQREGLSEAAVNILFRITNMTRRPVNTFDDTVSVPVPTELLQQAVQGASIYSKVLPMAPGRYRLSVAAKDVIGGNMTTYEAALDVPQLEDERITSSSLILADVLEKVPTKSIGTGPFVIGSSKVRPRMNETFRRDEKLGIYLQLYNFQADDKTRKPDGVIDYEIVKKGSNDKVFEFSEDISALSGGASQVVVEKLLPLQSLEPGEYTLKIRALDKRRNQTVTPSASFTVI
jgi:GWxTD domain-containing protein